MKKRQQMHHHDPVGLSLAIDVATIERQNIRHFLAHIITKILIICEDSDLTIPVELN